MKPPQPRWRDFRFTPTSCRVFRRRRIINALGTIALYFPDAALATPARKASDPGLLTDRFTIISTGLTAFP